MNISIFKGDKPYSDLMLAKRIHLIVPASESLGFGGTRAYLHFNCRMDDIIIERFIDEVNDKDTVSSLYPSYNMAVFPLRPEKFNQYIREIIELEMKYIQSDNIVIDFFANSVDNETINKFLEELKSISSDNQELNYLGQIEIRTSI